jgi:aspartate/methionine/tyrosine aminotransferase
VRSCASTAIRRRRRRPARDRPRWRAPWPTSTTTTAGATSLRQAIADRHGVALDQVAIGAGSDEFIVLLARIYAEGGTVATVPAFSYSMYRYAALMAGATVIDDPARRPTWSSSVGPTTRPANCPTCPTCPASW